MEVIKNGSVPEEDATTAPLFYGGAVSRQPIVGGGKSSYYNFSQVNFAAGAKNKFHTHTSDQILFVTKGMGIVANESEAQWAWLEATLKAAQSARPHTILVSHHPPFLKSADEANVYW